MNWTGRSSNINSQEFMDSHPEFVYHNMEFGSGRTKHADGAGARR